MRIFLDTNVLAIGLMSHRLCRDLLDRILIERAVVLGAPVQEELHRILTVKFRVPAALWDELESRLREVGQAPAADNPLSLAYSDPNDISILACAVAAKAVVSVTGDKALLDLVQVEGMQILSPRRLWQKLSEPGR